MTRFLASVAALLTFILPVQAFAMVTPYFVATSPALSTSVNRFYNIGLGGAASPLASNGLAASPVAIPGTFGNLYVSVSAAPGAAASGKSFAFVIMKNNVASSVTCTILETATTCNDTIDSIAVVPGDTISVRSAPTNTPNAANMTLSITLTGTNADEASIQGGNFLTFVTDIFDAVTGGNTSVTENVVSDVFPTNGTIDDLYVSASGADTATTTIVINGSATNITCPIAGGTSCSDLIHSLAVSTGDTISIELNSAVNSPTMGWGFRFKPTIDGEAPIFGASSANYFNGRFPRIQGVGGNLTTEVSTQAIVPINLTFEKGILQLITAPGGATTRGFISRNNFATGTISVSITGASTQNQDTTHTDSATVGTFYDVYSVLTGTPAANANHRQSFVAFIAPAATGGISNTIINGATAIFKGGIFNFL